MLTTSATPSYHEVDPQAVISQLVQMNLAPVLNLNKHAYTAYLPSEAAPIKVNPPSLSDTTPVAMKTGQSVIELPVEAYEEISKIAYGLYYQYRSNISITEDDLEQEGLIRAFKDAQRYDPTVGKVSLKKWVVCAARMQMLDVLRKEREKAEKSLDAYLEKTDTADKDDVLADIPTQTRYTSEEKRTPILNVLYRLPIRQRLAIMARYGIENESGNVLTPEQVMKRLGLTPTQYKSACSHARTSLKKLLQVD